MVDNPFRRYLLAGERIAWTGQPGQGLILTPRDTFLIPFSLLWCGFAIFWTSGVANQAAPLFFTLWGMMFVCVGLYFVAGRFIVDAWVRRGTYYAVTDRRILISRSAPFSKFTAINLAQLPAIDLDVKAKGRGTLRFGQAVSGWGNRGFSSWSPAFDPTPQFIAINDARHVFDLVERSKQKIA
jgi:hypothetical protein